MLNEQDLQVVKEQAETKYKLTAGRARRARGRVIGVGIGPKLKAGVLDPNKVCIRFYVEKKIKPKEDIEPGLLINEEYQGVPTDVIETGRLVSFQAGPGSTLGLDQRDLPPNVDPARTGTLGAIVKIGEKFYVLGSNHAMAVNGRATGARIMFRPPSSFINNPNDSIFARITNHVHLEQPGPNHVDCALAEIEAEYLGRVKADFPNKIVTSKAATEPKPNMDVKRVDESEESNGKIVSVKAQPRFDFSFGSFDFEDLIMIEGGGKEYREYNQQFAGPGDSGALVAGLEGTEYKAAALVIGGSRKLQKDGSWKFYTFACSFNACLAELGRVLANPASQKKGNQRIELVVSLDQSGERITQRSTTVETGD